jgi:hypothetical protein
MCIPNNTTIIHFCTQLPVNTSFHTYLPPDTTLWGDTGLEQINAAFVAYLRQPSAGGQADPVCKWMFDWSTSAAGVPAMHRFAARYAPLLAAKYLLLDRQSAVGAQGLGLEVTGLAITIL